MSAAIVPGLAAAPTHRQHAPSARCCPVCHVPAASAIHRQRYALFDDSALPSETTIVACDACSTVYARSHATADAYRRHYAAHSKYAAATASGSGERAADARRLDDLAAFLAGEVAATASVLDIGAGRGGLLLALRRAGFVRVTGLDPSADCVAAVRAAGCEADVGELEDARWPTDPRRFDVVVLSHVLEHVFDVDDAFRRIAERSSGDGCIYVEVPDASRYTVDGFPPFYFFDPEHINHFDVAALQALAARHGWTAAARWPRLLDLGAGQRYPAIGVLLRRRLGAIGPLEPMPEDPSCADAVTAYARASIAAATGGDSATLERLAADGTPLVVWGAGSHAQRLLAQTPLRRCAIDCIIDGDPAKQGRRLAGFPVVAPNDGLRRAVARSACIVVAIAVDGESVVDRLRRTLPSHPVVRL